MQIHFRNKRIIFGSKIQMVDRIIMSSSIFREKKNFKSESLNFYVTLGTNNEGCQELYYIATHHKKVHYLALQWYYLSSTVTLRAIPAFNFKPQLLLFRVSVFKVFFFPRVAIT